MKVDDKTAVINSEMEISSQEDDKTVEIGIAKSYPSEEGNFKCQHSLTPPEKEYVLDVFWAKGLIMDPMLSTGITSAQD